MGVLGAQRMFAYIQAHLALPQHQQGAVGGAGGSFLANDAASTSYARAGSFRPPRRTVRRAIGPRGQKTDCTHW